MIARLRRKLAKIQGITLYSCRRRRTSPSAARLAQDAVSIHLQDADPDELNQWAPQILDKLKTLPEMRDVATDQQNAGADARHLTIERDQAARFGILPRRSTTRSTTPSASAGRRNTSPSSTVSRHPGGRCRELQCGPDALNSIYVKSPSTGQQVPLIDVGRHRRRSRRAAVDQPSGQFPSVTLSFNLAPGVALGQAVNAIQKAEAEIGTPLSLDGSFQGNAQAFRASLTSEPILIAAALVVIYIILGVLYESYIHPITILSTLPSAGLGALLMLMVVRIDLSA